jgi:aspartate aminotransferase/aminotransferase
MEQYRSKRDRIYRGLVEAGYEVVKPDGAFYIFPKCPWGTSQEFVAEAIRHTLLVIPGDVFSERNTHFRIAYAATDQTIDRGIEILARLKKQGGPS